MDASRAFIDTTVGRTDSASLKIVAGGGRGFGLQTLNVQPYRQYEVGYWIKEQGASGELLAKIYDPSAGRFRESHENNAALSYSVAQGGWQQKKYVFNSAASTQAQLRLGSWGSTGGTVWFDDIKFEEIALHHVVRNLGSPMKVYDGTTVYEEGADYNPIREPYSKLNGMTYRMGRVPLMVTLPAGSRLTPGLSVQIDYDAVQPVHDEQYGASLTEPGVKEYYARNITELRRSFAPGSG